MKAILKNYRQSPRKVRLVTDLIKGKKVSSALDTLNFTTKRAVPVVKKLLESAIANAVHAGLVADTLKIKNITVDEGVVLKRMMPRARGVGARINKRTSHIHVTLSIIEENKKKTTKTAKKSK
ncbi:50S ribosomal protein L22 [Arenimonas sp.]|nr:50S ribosomal protein L22 [Candidatus Parcubacteria bacterium]